jgi:hypothetical protein
MWMGRGIFSSLLRPAWTIHYRSCRLLLPALKCHLPLRLHCCRLLRWNTCRPRLWHACLRSRSFLSRHHQRNPRRLIRLCSLPTHYRRHPIRHRRLPSRHRLRLSRRPQRLGRQQNRHHLRDFTTNTTGISATSAENIITKNHIFTVGFAITNKINISVCCPQQGGGAVCIARPCLYV